MERWPIDQVCSDRTVQEIAKEWQTEGSRMSADLMSPASDRMCLEKNVPGQMFEDTEVGPGGLAVAAVDHGSVSMSHIGPEGMTGAGLIPSGLALSQGMVCLHGLVLLELETQQSVGLGIARKHEHAARHLVQPMDDPKLSKVGFQQLDEVL